MTPAQIVEGVLGRMKRPIEAIVVEPQHPSPCLVPNAENASVGFVPVGASKHVRLPYWWVVRSSYRPPAVHVVVALADDLGNADVGVLLDEPLIDGAAGFEPMLTSDQWASLIQQRRATGRPLHLCEVR